VSAGFDVVSVANNHALDGGSAGLASTLTHLRAHGLAPTGALPHTGDQEPIVLRAGDLRVSFLAYTYNGTGPRGPVLEPALAGLDLPRLQAEIATARARSDYVVVALHMGYSRPRPTGEQRHFAHGAIDAGAHLVVGGHPHRPQELERYRGGLIAYSLGDFVFDHPGVSLDGAVLELTLDGTTPVRLALASTRMNEDFQPIVIREVVWDAAALRGPDGVLAAPAGGACNVWPLPCVIGSPCPRLPRSRPPFARASAGSGASATA
jgi:poly-gamma-glutamate capsule biosynthesis protein CapA/YwtB (metallophosphatase superfamily)